MKLTPLGRLSWRRALGLLAVASLALVPAASAAEGTCGITGVPRVVAVGDIHASYDNLLKVLTMAGLLDASAHWAGGRAFYVQVGDMLDRGVQARPVLDLLMRLEKEARKAGGRVVVLLGNHEVMNMLGDLRYVQAAEYEEWKEPDTARFQTPPGKTRRMRFVEAVTRRAREEAKAAGQPFDEEAYRQKILDQTPPGFVERVQALSASGEYGQWLREHDVVATVNGVAFVHGGLTPEVAALGCEGINRKVRSELGPDLAQTRANPREALATGESGPLWYRGLAQEDEATLLPSVERVLQSMKVKAVVIGHTPTGDGKIRPRFEGRVVMIDVGMTAEYGGHLAALELGPDGSFSAIYPTGRESLERKAADTANR
ncbi:MAG TPA: metallophosphoesterase [Anaeromyxobacteraceae bacterium]|nr:metallophosphoesterase [Anaeromyxobacteraceae bacterium]